MTASSSSRTRIRRHPERAQTHDAAKAILAEGLVAHVATVQEGWPVVLPFTYHYDGDRIYLHGSSDAGTLRALRKGAPVCVEVTLADDLIASRTATNHSMNYRTAVCFGTARLIVGLARKRAVLEAMIGRYFPGRTAGIDYANVTTSELKETALFEVEVEAMSAKARSGGPAGATDSDPTAPGAAGIVPLAPGPRSV
ncbi:MAG: pyridoxamine 5'-phosphate oxidase family protein [Chloroflexi bacterium]|nr:pyridoxamine 5'-phosphate oxidase family protein [Chloroflexota bacterium]